MAGVSLLGSELLQRRPELAVQKFLAEGPDVVFKPVGVRNVVEVSWGSNPYVSVPRSIVLQDLAGEPAIHFPRAYPLKGVSRKGSFVES